jgi:dTDP-4-dehydrorhamnose 3,5-epimerase-like enzyme
MAVAGCRIIDLPRITDPRGNLTFIEQSQHVPFEIRRVYYLYDVPGGESRGGHAHKTNEAFIVSASGSFDVVVRDGVDERRFFLNRPYYGLYIPAMTWRELENFSSGSVCVVLASQLYEPDDYYRDYDEFIGAAGHEQ